MQFIRQALITLLLRMGDVDPETLLEWLQSGAGEERDMQLIALEQVIIDYIFFYFKDSSDISLIIFKCKNDLNQVQSHIKLTKKMTNNFAVTTI